MNSSLLEEMLEAPDLSLLLSKADFRLKEEPQVCTEALKSLLAS